MPLSHPPGRAQFDFGEATVEIAGERRKAALAVMTLPYSDAFFVSAYPRECTETFQQGHLASLRVLRRRPHSLDYDNTSIAVSKVMGRGERELTREFLRLESHFLFAHRFCRVAGATRRASSRASSASGVATSWSPCPRSTRSPSSTSTWPPLCFYDLFRRVRGKAGTKASASRPTAPRCWRCRRRVRGPPRRSAQGHSLSLVRFDRNDYSVPTSSPTTI